MLCALREIYRVHCSAGDICASELWALLWNILIYLVACVARQHHLCYVLLTFFPFPQTAALVGHVIHCLLTVARSPSGPATVLEHDKYALDHSLICVWAASCDALQLGAQVLANGLVFIGCGGDAVSEL